MYDGGTCCGLYCGCCFVRFGFRLSRQKRLGIIATLLLTVATVLLLSWYYASSISFGMSWFIPLGVFVSLFWLAWSDLKKIPWWNWVIMFGIALVCMIKPGTWFVGIPIIGYILFVRRKK